jgi:hypothetical protein
MSQAFESAVRASVVKSTYSNLSGILTAYWSGDRKGNGLVDAIHNSPRLTQWAKVADGYRIWSADESISVTVTTEKIYTSKGVRVDDLQKGLPAQTLYNAIETAQAIVQTRGETQTDDEFFAPGEDYNPNTSLDAALEESHSKPLTRDDEELIEDVTAEDALDADQRVEDGPAPIVTVSQKFIEAVADHVSPPPSYAEQANRKNANTDGVICQYCGNLNKQAYRGNCPQCPKPATTQSVAGTVTVVQTADASFKELQSLQGRVLTIIDACFSDKVQRENVKTLIKKEFRRSIEKVGGDE